MSSVSVWVLGIVGIIVISVLVDVIMPSGQTSKFIKTIFGYLIILVILSPVFSFFSQKNVSIEQIFQPQTSTTLSGDFVASVNRQFLNKLENSITKSCQDAGISFAQVGIKADIFESKVEILQISINLQDAVINANLAHKDVRTTICQCVLENIKIEKEKIVIYE